jgi:hypothetical protein
MSASVLFLPLSMGSLAGDTDLGLGAQTLPLIALLVPPHRPP